MAGKQEECKSLKADCEECGAEVVITTLYTPPFRDIYPVCPYCGFPMTKDRAAGEELLKELTKRIELIREKLGVAA